MLRLAIRAETKNRWERRVPLTPSDVARLIRETGATVLVETSNKRVFKDAEYAQAGAKITNSLHDADVILGVKEVPSKHLIPGKTYMFFSHTHKGQAYNMPMLREIIQKNIRLIDYELMVDENKKRLVLFSKFAGYAGVIDGLHCLGNRLLARGYGTPFLVNLHFHFTPKNVAMSYNYKSIKDVKEELAKVGSYIKKEGLPADFGPFVFAVTGFGNVSQAALEFLQLLPHKKIKASKLPDLAKTFDNKHVYIVTVDVEDHIVQKNGQNIVSRKDYFENPGNYTSTFAEKIAPHITVLVNGVYWDARYPRLLTTEQTQELFKNNKLRLLTIADISCDIKGSLEFMSHATTIDQPFFMYDPETNTEHHNIEGPGIQIMSIDNLPTEMPFEASKYFSSSLYPFAKLLALGKLEHPVLKGATITTGNALADAHQKLENNIKQKNKVLLLGSGYVAGPVVEYLLKKKRSVTIASNNMEEAQKLAKGRDSVSISTFDVNESEALSRLVGAHDVVVSFIPAQLHHLVAQFCIEHRKPLVTASYVSPAMAALDERAKENDVLLLNELGLDPGIDHLTAKKMIDEHSDWKVTKFVSWCGGLPAPEFSDNPLGYKFSWSPRGVLLATQNPAEYKWDGKIVKIDGRDLLKSYRDVQIYKGFAFEGIPNRDSLKYTKIYGLKEVNTMFRGTLRYKGYCESMASFGNFGLLSQNTQQLAGREWVHLLNSKKSKRHVLAELVGRDISGLSDQEQVSAILEKLPDGRLVENLKWLNCFFVLIARLGLFRNAKISSRANTMLDAFSNVLEQKCKYAPGERDMIAMHHEFSFERSGQKKSATSTLILYGSDQETAMAKTVGLPAAIATNMILDGKIQLSGVQIPVQKEIYAPVLDELDAHGIRMIEKIV